MKYLKSFIVGLAVAIAAAVIYVLIALAESLPANSSVDSVAVVTIGWIHVGPLLLLVTLVAFALGFFWMLRRTSAI